MVGIKDLVTPMSTSTKLALNHGTPFVDITLYQSVIGIRQYLSSTHLNVTYSTNKLS